MKTSLLTSLVLCTTLLGCSGSSDDNANDGVSDYNDSKAAIDLTRGGYTCYQMVTSMGNIDIAVDNRQAPITAANFKQYVDSEFYNNTMVHRVVKDFVIQAGGFDTDFKAKETRTPIINESTNGLKNYRGRLAMARTRAVNSATSQFFINTVDNPNLNYRNSDNVGYAVFGGVIAGMDVVDAMASVETSTQSNFPNVPNTQITIDRVSAVNCPAQ